MRKKNEGNKRNLYEEDEEVIDKTGADQKRNERVFNYKVTSEVTREIERKGISFIAKLYKTTANTVGIRIPLRDNGPLFEKFYEYCQEIEKERKEEERKANLIAFTTFGKLDKGLEFFPTYGFYVYPFLVKGKEPFLIFNQEKDTPSPMKRLELFIDYYRKKLGIEVRPKKSIFNSLKGLDLTEI